MSTSPSWFDQEKLNRLVKKVGPKKLSEPAPSTPAPTSSQPLPPAPSASQPLPPAPSASQPLPPAQRDSQPLPAALRDSQRLSAAPPESAPSTDETVQAENIASTARISLVSKPASALSEQRSLPALPRRTTPLPGLKTLFQSPEAEPVASPVAEMASVITQPLPETSAPKPEKPAPPSLQESDIPPLTDPLAAGDGDLAGIWQKMALLNEELAQTIQERDHALGDINQMREQLRLSDELIAKNKGAITNDDLAQLARERDEAQAELKALKDNPPKRESQQIKLPDGVTKTKELIFLTQERDQARKEYAELRKQFEGFKRGQGTMVTGAMPPPLPRDDVAKVRKELEQQLDGFRLQLEEKKKEIAELKAAAAAATPPPLPAAAASGEGDEKLKGEIAALKEQAAKSKEDATIAQRGLALSQKALQETRDTLREATEGTSLSRHNFDNLKNECASLTQQNTVLQAQNEQLSRELAAAKQRQSGRIQM